MAESKAQRALQGVSANGDEAASRIVLVATYKEEQLTEWPGWYNYPISDDDKISEADAANINELWLFKGTKEERRYKAQFIGVKSRRELIDSYAYPAKGKPHAERYLLFKTLLMYKHTGTAPQDAHRIFIRTADFSKRSPKIASQLKAYLESPDRDDPILARRLPSIVTSLPPEKLRVCESAVQMSFWGICSDDDVEYKKSNGSNYRIASLFAGCGGLDLGFVGGFEFLGEKFARNKFDIVWANELNPNACKTYERNLGHHIVCGDIKDKISELPENVDVIMGGFPCQDISINGKMLGINGKRSSLYSYIVEAVRRCQPKVFVAENVGSLMLKQHEHSFKTILSDFEALNYNVTYKVYHAEEYGVPQTRERIIFVGTRKDLPAFVPPYELSSAPITCGEAIHDLEDIPADKAFSHVWSEAAPSGEQGSRKMVEGRPGYTIRAECHGNIQFHYKLPRRLSMREAARIQSFPDTFVFPCGIRETERQIGNAVPPVLAWRIAQSIQKVLEESK